MYLTSRVLYDIILELNVNLCMKELNIEKIESFAEEKFAPVLDAKPTVSSIIL